MSLNLLTVETPNILVIDERNNARWVITKSFAEGAPNTLTVHHLGRADGSGTPSAANPIHMSVREITANITSGVWAFSYLCTPNGERAIPLSDDEFTALAINVRTARRAKATATAALEVARAAFREAEAAVATATNAAAQAEREWNNAL